MLGYVYWLGISVMTPETWSNCGAARISCHQCALSEIDAGPHGMTCCQDVELKPTQRKTLNKKNDIRSSTASS